MLAIDRWNRLTAEEQQRFRELAGRSQKAAGPSLSKEELKELGRFWKRLEMRSLVREGIAMLTRRNPTTEEPDDAENAARPGGEGSADA